MSGKKFEYVPCPCCGGEARAQFEVYGTWVRDQIRTNASRIRRWKAEGRSYYWMAGMIGVPENNSNAIRKWLAKQGWL